MSLPALHPSPVTPRLPHLPTPLESSRLETLHRLAREADRGDVADDHTARVAAMAASIAERLGLPADDVELLRHAAPLHDIGKLSISHAILHKPGALTPDEWRQMRRHVASGAAMLSGSASEIIQLAREIALTHHEWWDGSGYPSRMAGETIPLSGRIVALADVFDALTHERPYKRAWPLSEAVAEIRRLKGTQFDPAVVDAFDSLMN